MKEPTFAEYDSEYSVVEITWVSDDKRLCVSIDDEVGIDVFGVSKGEIIGFPAGFLEAYKWFEESW